jgi:hypothetical protein
VCSYRTPPTHWFGGNRNMLYPYTFGQSGTDMPARFVVTSPPMKMSGKVAAAVARASRCRAGL